MALVLLRILASCLSLGLNPFLLRLCTAILLIASTVCDTLLLRLVQVLLA